MTRPHTARSPLRRPLALAVSVALAVVAGAARAQVPTPTTPTVPPPAMLPPLPSPAAAPAPTVAPPLPDLGALGVQEDNQAGADEHPLQIYGFADVTYYLPLFPKTSFLAAQLPENQQFVMGNFNLYLAKEISDRLRALGEVRFLYLPDGQTTGNGYLSTQVDDPANLYRPVNWAGISIQRLYLEYDLLSNLTIRAGQFLTPYGIWNVDHGTPTLISIRAPYVIGEALFPVEQTGLELYGHTFFSEVGLEYHLTLSNGRGPIDDTRDLDSNKAIGGRLVLEWKREFDLKIGFSYYRGLYTNRTPLSFDPTTGTSTSTILERYEEQAVGADASLDWGGLVFRGEILDSDHRYDANFRGFGPTFTPDNRRWGTYGLVGYHLPWNLMPFASAQYYKFPETPGNQYNPAVRAFAAGLNYRLHPSVVLKAEYTYATLPGSPLAVVRDQPLNVLETQVSWVF
ncbi:MAG TPA: hypothetical protein VKZ18_02600 [Polyangia bacterium]|nr:hypothetical protein [Polyangia bacterium]